MSEMKVIAELVVRQFFDHWLEVFPEQLAAALAAHNNDVEAHKTQINSAVKAESSRVKIWLMSLIFTSGFGIGVGLWRLIGV